MTFVHRIAYRDEVVFIVRLPNTSTPERPRDDGLLERIANLIPAENPFVELVGDSFETEGRLAGVTVAVKDVISVRHTTLRAGSKVYARPSTDDAAVVGLLRSQGATVLGTTRTHELAFGPTGLNPHDRDGGLRNPHDASRIAGGSSVGSAVAVARGLAVSALGTDTGGSVRVPAAFCGVVGYKPTNGIIPLQGVLPLAPTLDHVGILGRAVGDVSRIAAVLAAPFGDEAVDARGLVVGIPDDVGEGTDQSVVAAVERCISLLRQDGVHLQTVRMPSTSLVSDVSSTILLYEASRVHGQMLVECPGDLSPQIRARLERGAEITSDEYAQALLGRREAIVEIRRLFGQVDIVVNPTVPVVPPTVDEISSVDLSASLVRNTRLGNLVGCPAVSVPVPGHSLPIGIQVSGGRGCDRAVLEFASYLESLLSGYRLRG